MTRFFIKQAYISIFDPFVDLIRSLVASIIAIVSRIVGIGSTAVSVARRNTMIRSLVERNGVSIIAIRIIGIGSTAVTRRSTMIRDLIGTIMKLYPTIQVPNGTGRRDITLEWRFSNYILITNNMYCGYLNPN